jgi:hypothetical protein
MLTRRLTTALVAALCLAACDPTTAAQPDPGALGPAAPVDLAGLIVAPEATMTGYERELFPHWAASDTPSCDTREIALQRQGSAVVQDAQCRAVSGHWLSPYDGVEIADSSAADVDHLVPLAEAWRSGAVAWTTPARRAFANDLAGDQLIVVSATSNRSKSDQDPAHWKPTVQSHWCLYATRWITVKLRYQLTADPSERDHLAAMLATCPTTQQGSSITS